MVEADDYDVLQFKTYEWSLTLDDGRVIQLLDPNRDPLSGAAL